MTGVCAFGNKLPVSIRCGVFLDYQSTFSVLKNNSPPWIYFVKIKLCLQLSAPQSVSHHTGAVHHVRNQ
jgi:hypothetical protein